MLLQRRRIVLRTQQIAGYKTDVGNSLAHRDLKVTLSRAVLPDKCGTNLPDTESSSWVKCLKFPR
jgi:hypothetical protein